MISNVYQYNTNTKGCLKEIYKANPDVVFLLETNNTWKEGTDELNEKYPYHIKVPQENTYGMLLYSKLELTDSKVKFIVENDIPSIHTKLILKSGATVMLYGIHPTPPSPTENERSTERDKELLLIADIVKEQDKPVIVIGDLNDVAWSHTTSLFLKMSGLLDPRRGRGFFNSFHARYPFLRFPLDHAFISPAFKLNKIKRLDSYGSDHFPIFIEIQYEPQDTSDKEVMQPDTDDIKEANEKKNKK
ncbi:endonuclease/exonuclease/phosphatase family protein [Flavobacterium arcticum]|nr:endonuclease/exonuclease/phosphatase family protein [Flavobacterium arcticum]